MPVASPGPLAARYNLACDPQDQTWHLTSLYCSLQLGVSIPIPLQNQGQNALASCTAEDHISILLIRWLSQVNECRGCCRNTLPASAMTASAAIASSAHDVSVPPQKTYTWGCRQSQFKLGLWVATRRCLLELILARWCLCTTVAPIICLALSCQPSCDIAGCYVDVLSGPGCRCWQTRIGGCWWKRLLMCVCLCVSVCEWYSRHGWDESFLLAPELPISVHSEECPNHAGYLS